jgi:hypothetical protein
MSVVKPPISVWLTLMPDMPPVISAVIEDFNPLCSSNVGFWSPAQYSVA